VQGPKQVEGAGAPNRWSPGDYPEKRRDERSLTAEPQKETGPGKVTRTTHRIIDHGGREKKTWGQVKKKEGGASMLGCAPQSRGVREKNTIGKDRDGKGPGQPGGPHQGKDGGRIGNHQPEKGNRRNPHPCHIRSLGDGMGAKRHPEQVLKDYKTTNEGYGQKNRGREEKEDRGQ